MRVANTKTRGITSELIITSKFSSYEDCILSYPYGDNAPYDLLVDYKGHFIKVQCKTATKRGNVERIPLYSRIGVHRRGKVKYIDRGIDLVAGYAPESEKIYLIDLHKYSEISEICLRTVKSKNNQSLRVNYAEDFEFEKVFNEYIESLNLKTT